MNLLVCGGMSDERLTTNETQMRVEKFQVICVLSFNLYNLLCFFLQMLSNDKLISNFHLSLVHEIYYLIHFVE